MESTNLIKIKNITKIGRARVINLNVHKNHTFVTKNGIITHNCDYLTQNAQAVLRTDTEVFSVNARFIFTGNYKERIMPQLLQRMQVFDLDEIYANNKKELGKQIFERMSFILKAENVQYKNEDVLEIIKTFYPSTREMLMFSQQNTVNNELIFDSINSADDIFGDLISSMQNRKFKDVKTVINEILIPDNAYTYFWKNIDGIFEMESQPQVIMLLAEYQDYSQKARNKYIPLMAMIVKIISDGSIKFK